MARSKPMNQFIKIGSSSRLHTAHVDSNNTLMFDVTGERDSMVCSNLTHAQAKQIRAILNAFIETEPRTVSLTITASPERIQALRNDPTLRVRDTNEDW